MPCVHVPLQQTEVDSLDVTRELAALRLRIEALETLTQGIIDALGKEGVVLPEEIDSLRKENRRTRDEK